MCSFVHNCRCSFYYRVISHCAIFPDYYFNSVENLPFNYFWIQRIPVVPIGPEAFQAVEDGDVEGEPYMCMSSGVAAP
jgi:hypothetical protein